jgi:hypothetical protein
VIRSPRISLRNSIEKIQEADLSKRVLAFVLLVFASVAWAQIDTFSGQRMSVAAQRFLNALSAESRAAAVIPFDDAERQNWHYIPRDRRGVSIKQLTPEQRELGSALLRSGLSEDGLRKADGIRRLDRVLFEQTGATIRDENLYYFSLFGQPANSGPWGWRFEGHHISLNFTLRDGRVVSTTPFFFGANPAEVRSGPQRGTRVLAAEEEMGRALLRSLSEAQHAKAIISGDAPADVLASPGNSARLDQQGILYTELSAEQQKQLMSVIEMYAHRLDQELAGRELLRIGQAGVEKLRFAWAGGSEAGQPHYYRIQGPTFVIEYDNTQNSANHIHTVWRDPERDFGLDPLRAHYASSPHHRHARAASTGPPLHRTKQQTELLYTRK